MTRSTFATLMGLFVTVLVGSNAPLAQDMSKAVYDTNNDGTVDQAAALAGNDGVQIRPDANGDGTGKVVIESSSRSDGREPGFPLYPWKQFELWSTRPDYARPVFAFVTEMADFSSNPSETEMEGYYPVGHTSSMLRLFANDTRQADTAAAIQFELYGDEPTYATPGGVVGLYGVQNYDWQPAFVIRMRGDMNGDGTLDRSDFWAGPGSENQADDLFNPRFATFRLRSQYDSSNTDPLLLPGSESSAKMSFVAKDIQRDSNQFERFEVYPDWIKCAGMGRSKMALRVDSTDGASFATCIDSIALKDEATSVQAPWLVTGDWTFSSISNTPTLFQSGVRSLGDMTTEGLKEVDGALRPSYVGTPRADVDGNGTADEPVAGSKYEDILVDNSGFDYTSYGRLTEQVAWSPFDVQSGLKSQGTLYQRTTLGWIDSDGDGTRDESEGAGTIDDIGPYHLKRLGAQGALIQYATPTRLLRAFAEVIGTNLVWVLDLDDTNTRSAGDVVLGADGVDADGDGTFSVEVCADASVNPDGSGALTAYSAVNVPVTVNGVSTDMVCAVNAAADWDDVALTTKNVRVSGPNTVELRVACLRANACAGTAAKTLSICCRRRD